MAGEYQAYPEYQESGEEWLGRVPSHWDVIQIKHLSTVKRGASPRPIDDAKYFDDDGEYAWTRIADVTASDVYLSKAPQRLSDLGSSLSVKLEPESLFLSIAGTVGKPCITGMKACIHDGFVYFPELKIPNKFLFYVFAGEQAYKGLGKFGTQLNLNTDTVGGIKIGCTSNEEIKGIINFLDHETAKIDTLIEKQQQLIKLLKEKRQAVISHAVTKGLNPNAPMRDSGVEWLGEVPEHWEVKRLRYLGFCQNGINIGAEYFGSGYPFVSYGDAYKNEVLPEYGSGLVQSTEQDRKIYSVVAGDVIFTRTSETVEEIGFSSTCLKTIEYATFAGFLIRFRPTANILDSGFSKYYFRNILMRDFFIKEMNLVTRASLSQDLLKKLPVTLPPLEEQAQIAVFLSQKSMIFAKLTENAESAIELLKERRKALISAAVTGKIDVRNWRAPEPSNTTNKNNKEAAA